MITMRISLCVYSMFNCSEASVQIDVVNALTATVRVSASDRPGLLQDVADAINQVGLSVESAEVNTHMDLYAINTYIVKIAEGTAEPFSDPKYAPFNK